MTRQALYLSLVLFVMCWGCGGDESAEMGGAGGAGAEGGSGGSAGAGGAPASDMGPDVFVGAPECSDNEDNDGDGLIDLDDPGCENAVDNDEQQRHCSD